MSQKNAEKGKNKKPSVDKTMESVLRVIIITNLLS